MGASLSKDLADPKNKTPSVLASTLLSIVDGNRWTEAKREELTFLVRPELMNLVRFNFSDSTAANKTELLDNEIINDKKAPPRVFVRFIYWFIATTENTSHPEVFQQFLNSDEQTKRLILQKLREIRSILTEVKNRRIAKDTSSPSSKQINNNNNTRSSASSPVNTTPTTTSLTVSTSNNINDGAASSSNSDTRAPTRKDFKEPLTLDQFCEMTDACIHHVGSLMAVNPFANSTNNNNNPTATSINTVAQANVNSNNLVPNKKSAIMIKEPSQNSSIQTVPRTSMLMPTSSYNSNDATGVTPRTTSTFKNNSNNNIAKDAAAKQAQAPLFDVVPEVAYPPDDFKLFRNVFEKELRVGDHLYIREEDEEEGQRKDCVVVRPVTAGDRAYVVTLVRMKKVDLLEYKMRRRDVLDYYQTVQQQKLQQQPRQQNATSRTTSPGAPANVNRRRESVWSNNFMADANNNLASMHSPMFHDSATADFHPNSSFSPLAPTNSASTNANQYQYQYQQQNNNNNQYQALPPTMPSFDKIDFTLVKAKDRASQFDFEKEFRAKNKKTPDELMAKWTREYQSEYPAILDVLRTDPEFFAGHCYQLREMKIGEWHFDVDVIKRVGYGMTYLETTVSRAGHDACTMVARLNEKTILQRIRSINEHLFAVEVPAWYVEKFGYPGPLTSATDHHPNANNNGDFLHNFLQLQNNYNRRGSGGGGGFDTSSLINASFSSQHNNNRNRNADVSSNYSVRNNNNNSNFNTNTAASLVHFNNYQNYNNNAVTPTTDGMSMSAFRDSSTMSVMGAVGGHYNTNAASISPASPHLQSNSPVISLGSAISISKKSFVSIEDRIWKNENESNNNKTSTTTTSTCCDEFYPMDSTALIFAICAHFPSQGSYIEVGDKYGFVFTPQPGRLVTDFVKPIIKKNSSQDKKTKNKNHGDDDDSGEGEDEEHTTMRRFALPALASKKDSSKVLTSSPKNNNEINISLATEEEIVNFLSDCTNFGLPVVVVPKLTLIQRLDTFLLKADHRKHYDIRQVEVNESRNLAGVKHYRMFRYFYNNLHLLHNHHSPTNSNKNKSVDADDFMDRSITGGNNNNNNNNGSLSRSVSVNNNNNLCGEEQDTPSQEILEIEEAFDIIGEDGDNNDNYADECEGEDDGSSLSNDKQQNFGSSYQEASFAYSAENRLCHLPTNFNELDFVQKLKLLNRSMSQSLHSIKKSYKLAVSMEDLLSPKNNNNTSHDNFSFGNASFAEQQQQLLQQSALANQTSSPSVMPSSTATLAPSGSSSHQAHLSLYQEPVAADVLEKYFSRTSNTPSNSNSPRLSNALAHHMLQSGNYQMKVPIRLTSTTSTNNNNINNNTSSSSENNTSTDLRASTSAGTTQSTSTAEYSPGLQAHNTRDSTSSPSERGVNSFNPLSQQQSSNHNQQNNAADVNGLRDNGASLQSQASSSSSPRSSAAYYATTATTTSDQPQQQSQQQQHQHQQQNFAGSIITITDASGLEEYLERFLVEFKMHFIVLQNMIVDEQVERLLLYSQIMLQTCAYRNAEVFGEYAKTFVPEMQIYKEKIKIQGFFDRYGNMNLKDGSSFFAWTEKYNNSQKALGLVDNLVNPDKIKQIILDEVKSIDDFIELREALDEPRIDFQSCMNLRKHQLPHYVTMRLQEMIALAKDERSWRNNYASAPNQLLERLRRTLPAEFVLDPTQVTYQMEVDVGSGTFGSVRPAHIVPKKFDCVAKIISSKDRSRLEGGIYEAKVYSELRNAGIVTFLGATIINNAIHPSLVILLERAIFDFGNFLRPDCTIPLSLDRIYRYSLQIASALRYLHTAKEVGFETGGGSPTSALLAPSASQWNRSLTQSASASPLTSSSSSAPTSKKVIVHLDLKPKNLLFFEGDVVKIADLGSVKEMDEENTHGEASGVNVTFAYSPPEYFIHRELEERRVMNDRKRSAFFGGNKDNNINNNKHELHARTSTANPEAKNNDDNQPSAEEKKQQQEIVEAKRLKKLEKKRQREEAKQLNKHKNVLFSPSFDIFSFGVILYRMISNGRASDLDQEHQAHRYVAGQLEVVKKNIRLQREQKRGAKNKARQERRQQETQQQETVVAASSTPTIDTTNNNMNPDQQQPSKLKDSDTEDFMKRIEMMSKGPLPNSNNKVTINNNGEDVENKKEEEKPLIQETSSNSPPSLGAMVLKTSNNSVGNKTNKNDSTTDESEKIENDDEHAAVDQHQAQDFTSLNNYAIPRPSPNIKAQNANANDDDDDNAGSKNKSSPKNTCSSSSSSSISSSSSDDDDDSVDLDEAALYSDDRGMERKCVIEHIIPEHRDFTHDHGKKLIALCKSCLMMHPKHRPHDGWDLSRKLLQICEEEAPEVFKAWGISKADLVRLNHKQVGEAHQNNQQNNIINNNEIVVDSGARPRAATITPSQVQKEHNNNTNTGSLLEFRSFSMTPAQKQEEENIRLKKVQSQSQKQQQQQSEERQESPCGAVENNAARLLPSSSDDKNSEDNQLAQRIASGASGASNGSNGNDNNNNNVNLNNNNNNASFPAVHSGSNEGTSHFVGHHHQQQNNLNNNYNYHHDPYEVTYDQHADYNQNDDKAVDYNQGYKPARLEHGQQKENDGNNSNNQTGLSATYAPDVTSTVTSDQ